MLVLTACPYPSSAKSTIDWSYLVLLMLFFVCLFACFYLICQLGGITAMCLSSWTTVFWLQGKNIFEFSLFIKELRRIVQQVPAKVFLSRWRNSSPSHLNHLKTVGLITADLKLEIVMLANHWLTLPCLWRLSCQARLTRPDLSTQVRSFRDVLVAEGVSVLRINI